MRHGNKIMNLLDIKKKILKNLENQLVKNGL